MTRIGKSFLIAVFTLAVFTLAIFTLTAFAGPSLAETAPAAKAEVKAETKTEAPKETLKTKELPKQDPKTVAPPANAVAPDASAGKTKEMIEAEEKAKQMAIKAQAKIDLKNLPKNLTPILPNDGETFAVAVGETKPIAAARQRKCLFKEAPEWENTKPRLPITGLVKFSDGGAYERDSNRCGGPVPARAVFATGVKVGSERVVIFGATITVIVKPVE